MSILKVVEEQDKKTLANWLKKQKGAGVYGKFVKEVSSMYDNVGQKEYKQLYAHIKKMIEKDVKGTKVKSVDAPKKQKATKPKKEKATKPKKEKATKPKKEKATSSSSASEYRFTALKKQKQAQAHKSSTNKIMGNKEVFYVVVKDDGKEDVLGAFINLSSAKSSASTHLSDIIRAYSPFIPQGFGRITRGQKMTDRNNKKKRLRATYDFGSGNAVQYLQQIMGKKLFKLHVYMVEVGGSEDVDKKYGSLVAKYNSPDIGSLRWNPKKRKSRKK